MAWQDELRKPSFRGVEFDATRRVSQRGGKRGQLHEFLGSERQAYFEELGRRARHYAIDAYISGDEYLLRHDQLIDALEAPGPGLLVHPYRGELTVEVLDYEVQESTEDGGIASFAIVFVEAGELVYPAPAPRTGELVKDAATSASTAAASTFEKIFSVVDEVQWVVEDAETIVELTSGALAQLTVLFPAGGTDLATLVQHLGNMAAAAKELVTEPGSLAAQTLEAVSRVASLAGPVDRTFDALERIAGFGADLLGVDPTTAARISQKRNREEQVHLVRRAAAVEAARSASRVPLASYSDAIALRDRVLRIVDAQADAAGELGHDEARRALRDLATSIIRDITARGAKLDRLTTFTPAGTVPVFVVAHRLYGDISRAEEIIARNRIRHPGFVPGGRPLQVLVAG